MRALIVEDDVILRHLSFSSLVKLISLKLSDVETAIVVAVLSIGAAVVVVDVEMLLSLLLKGIVGLGGLAVLLCFPLFVRFHNSHERNRSEQATFAESLGLGGILSSEVAGKVGLESNVINTLIRVKLTILFEERA
jgi:hypothetical protein